MLIAVVLQPGRSFQDSAVRGGNLSSLRGRLPGLKSSPAAPEPVFAAVLMDLLHSITLGLLKQPWLLPLAIDPPSLRPP